MFLNNIYNVKKYFRILKFCRVEDSTIVLEPDYHPNIEIILLEVLIRHFPGMFAIEMLHISSKYVNMY